MVVKNNSREVKNMPQVKPKINTAQVLSAGFSIFLTKKLLDHTINLYT